MTFRTQSRAQNEERQVVGYVEARLGVGHWAQLEMALEAVCGAAMYKEGVWTERSDQSVLVFRAT